MACGCPVVASDIAPLREAGGSAAEYCTVADFDAWSETVIRLLQERETAMETWEKRRANARRHAAQFTWSENANQTLAVYQRVCKAGNRMPQ
jgi:glycosyltransferase involved in cell wall biosynthesis